MTRMTGSVPDARSTTRPRSPSSDLRAVDGLADGRVAGRIHGLANFDVQQHLRELLHARPSSLEWLPGATHDGEHLQRRDEPVAGRRPVEADEVSRRLAAEDAAVLFSMAST